MIMKDPEIKRIVALKGEKKITVQTSSKEKKGYTIGPLITLSGKVLKTFLVWPSKSLKAFKINTPLNLFMSYREKV